jgi:anti-sigma factor RsiW
MRCREAQPLISAFHDGELGRSEQEAVRTHLMDCPACRAQAGDLLSISRWLEPAEAPAVSESFTDSVMARLRAGEGLGDSYIGDERRALVSLRWLAMAAALVVAVGGMFLALPNSSSNWGRGTLDAASTNDVEKEIERNNALARTEWMPVVASRPAPRRAK